MFIGSQDSQLVVDRVAAVPVERAVVQAASMPKKKTTCIARCRH